MFILLSSLMAGAAVSAYTAESARIEEIGGKVEVKLPGGGWETARPGMELAAGSMVSTGFGSRVNVRVENAVIRVEPLSRLSLAEIVRRGQEMKTDVRLRVGRIRVEIQKDESLKTDFTVRAAASTAAVRGTVFTYDGVNLRVIEGSVAMSNNQGRSRRYAAGQRGRVPAGGGNPAPAAAVADAGSRQKPVTFAAPTRTTSREETAPVDVVAAQGTLIINW